MKYYLVFLLCAFTLSQVARVETGMGFGIMFLDLLVILTSFPLFFIHSLWSKEKKDMLLKSWGVFTAFCLLSLLMNIPSLAGEKMLIASLYFLRFSSYLSLFFFLRKRLTPFVQQIEVGMLISGSVITLLGFVQLLLYPSLRNLYYLGWDEHMHRLFSVFLDPNFAGIFFALFILFLLNLYEKKKQPQLLYLLGIVLFALFLTYSRTAYLGVGIGIGIYAYLEKKKKILISFVLGAVGIGILFLPSFATDNTSLFRVASSVSRIESFKQGVEIAKDHLLFGVGFNAYKYAIESYGFLEKTDVLYNHSENGNSNSYLFVLVTTGIGGFLSYLFFLYQVGRQYLMQKKSYLFASLVVLLIGGLFNNALFYTPFLFWLFLLSAKENI